MQAAKLSKKELRALIDSWMVAAATSKTLQATELKLRETLVTQLAPNIAEGTFTKELDGFVCKVVCKINRKFDAAAFPSIKKALQDLPDKFAVDDYVKYSVGLDLTAYRGMPDGAAKQLFDTLLTETPGTPTLEIKEVLK